MKKRKKNKQLFSEIVDFMLSNSTCIFVLYEPETSNSKICMNESSIEIKRKKHQEKTKNQDNIINGLFVLFCVISIFILGILLNKLYITFWFLITFIPLRSFVGGVHTNTRIKCYIYSITLITAFLLVIPTVPIVMIDVFLPLSLLSIAIISPVEAKNNKLSLLQKKKYKKISCTICFFILILYLVGRFLKFFSLVYSMAITVFLSAILGLVRFYKTNEIFQLFYKIYNH